MSRFAPVAPVNLLSRLDEHDLAGDYHLLLAHDVHANAEAYQELCKDKYDWTVIMDNSVVELGEPVPPSVLREAVKVTNAKVVVLPDKLCDYPSTVALTRKALKDWAGEFSKGALRYVGLMVVPQGETITDWMRCAHELLEIVQAVPGVWRRSLWWGIPRVARDKLGLSRVDAIWLLRGLHDGMRIHLLGFSEDTIDDFKAASHPCVEGIDSAVPVRMGMAGELWLPGIKTPPRGEWWDKLKDEPREKLWITPQITSNILAARRYLRVGGK